MVVTQYGTGAGGCSGHPGHSMSKGKSALRGRHEKHSVCYRSKHPVGQIAAHSF